MCLVAKAAKGEYTVEERPDETEKERRGEGKGAREMFGLQGDWLRLRLKPKRDRNKVRKAKLSPRSQSNQRCEG